MGSTLSTPLQEPPKETCMGQPLSLTVNGKAVTRDVEPATLLV